MSDTMAVSTKHNPLFLFTEDSLGLLPGYYLGRRTVVFIAHRLTVMVENKRSDWQVIKLAISTSVSKFKNKTSFSLLPSLESGSNVFLHFLRRTLFAVSIDTKTIPMVFGERVKFFARFTPRTPFMSSAIYNWIHDNSVSQQSTVIKLVFPLTS